MRFYSCFKNLKVLHSKGIAIFRDGFFETDDKEIIKALKKDKNIRIARNIDDVAQNIRKM